MVNTQATRFCINFWIYNKYKREFRSSIILLKYIANSLCASKANPELFFEPLQKFFRAGAKNNFPDVIRL